MYRCIITNLILIGEGMIMDMQIVIPFKGSGDTVIDLLNAAAFVWFLKTNLDRSSWSSLYEYWSNSRDLNCSLLQGEWPQSIYSVSLYRVSLPLYLLNRGWHGLYLFNIFHKFREQKNLQQIHWANFRLNRCKAFDEHC